MSSATVAQLRQLTRRALLMTARDITALTKTRSALVLAPHPDDETLGCGATILTKLAAGMRVDIAMVTDGRHSHLSSILPPERLASMRTTEMLEAAARLGVSQDRLHWLGLEDGTVSEHEDTLVAVLEDLVARLAPDEIYATCAEEPHADHAAVGRAARRVAASTGTALLEYPVWLWHGWPVNRENRAASLADAGLRVVRRRAAVIGTRQHLSAKLHALDAHRTQLTRPAEITAGEEWAVLPAGVMAAASDDWELFFPLAGGRRR